MIKIKYNSEHYEITHENSRGVAELACEDYNASIEDHVQSIIEILAACNVEYELERL